MEKPKRELRVVSVMGRYAITYCDVDEDGYVVNVRLGEEPDWKFKNLVELQKHIEEVNAAYKKSVTTINAANRAELVVDGLGEG